MPPFWGQKLGPHLTESRLGRGLDPCQVASNPFSRLTTIDMGRKLGGGCAPFLGGPGSPSNTKSPGLRPTSIPSGILIHPAVWPQRTWAENWGLSEAYRRIKWYTNAFRCLATIDMGRKWGAVPLVGEGGARSPSNTMSPGPRPTSLPSGILIHLPVWPQ